MARSSYARDAAAADRTLIKALPPRSRHPLRMIQNMSRAGTPWPGDDVPPAAQEPLREKYDQVRAVGAPRIIDLHIGRC